MTVVIETPRLRLVPMNVAFIEAAIELRRDDAGRALGIRMTDQWPTGNESWLQIRLKQQRRDVSSAPWLSRAVVLAGTLIGRAGFHYPPRNGASEFGYEIDAPFRRLGYATEAAQAFIDWGFAQPELETIIACVAPSNEVSIRMLEKFGFLYVRRVKDPRDGVELRYELHR